MWQVFEGGGRCQGGCWGPHGGLEGPRCSQRPCRNAAAGGPRPPGAQAEVSGTGGVGPGATMALRCIVVEASKVFQSCLVTELVLVLREGRGRERNGGSISASPGLPRPRAPPAAGTSLSLVCMSLA